MGRLLGGSAPLRGRASLELIIRPFGYRDAARFWVSATPAWPYSSIRSWAGLPRTAGSSWLGIPLLAGRFRCMVLRTVLNPQLPLFREARYLLAEEMDIRDTAIYHAVLAR